MRTPLRRAALHGALRSATAAAALVALAGCSDNRINAPLETNVTPEGAGANPTRAIQLLTSGIVASDRDNHSAYVRDVAQFGREAWFFQLQDGRWITGYFRDFADNTSFGAGGNWAGRFNNLRNIFNLREALAQAGAAFTPAQVAGVNAFADTEEALQVHYLVNTRDALGTPVRVTDSPSGLTPFVSRDSAYLFMVGKLDAAATALAGAGSSFVFRLPTGGGSGYTGFDTPATYLTFNRALKARIEAYRGSLATGAERTARYQAARQALDASFITSTLTAANLNQGVYYIFSTATGDTPNGLWSQRNDLYANTSITTDASVPQTDARLGKLQTGQPGRSLQGSETSTLRFQRYQTADTPAPIIDNEELWLLRAEIAWFTGDPATAVSALNAVASVAGGATAARYSGFANDAAFIDALLTERRLSLLLEGHRWVDVRRFGRLNTLPAGGTGFTVANNQVVPQLECLARDRTGDAALRGTGCP